MAKYLKDKSGQVFEDLGDDQVRPVPAEEVKLLESGEGNLSQLGRRAVGAAESTLLGGAKLFGMDEYTRGLAQKQLDPLNAKMAAIDQVSPVLGFAGQAIPAVAAGLATAGAGPLAVMGTEALLGAASTPDAPFTGAAIGGVAGGLPFAGPAIRQAGQAAMRVGGKYVPDLADPFLRQGVVPSVSSPGSPRMAGRVTAAIDGAVPEPAPGQFYKGLMKSSQLDEAGVPMTPAMRTALDAPDAATADYAKKMLWKEGIQGVGDQEKRSQRMFMTNLVKNEMGVTDDVALTDTVIGKVLKDEGSNIGSILGARGPITMPETALQGMRGVVETAETGWQGALSNVVKNIEKNIEQNGALTPQGYQNAITKLGEIGAPGRSAGAIQDVKKLRDLLSKPVEGQLSAAEKKLLAEARYRYKIAKTLKQGQGVGSDMMVNPKSFGSNWDKKLAQTARGQDKIGQAADTMNFLSTMEANAGTTLQRGFAMAPGVAARAAPAAALGALGAPVAGAAFNQLFGQ